MKESVGYTVTLNIVITFIVIVFAFIAAILIYFKSNKAGNIIVNSIEKYEGYNSLSINEINNKISSLGYNIYKMNCGSSNNNCLAVNDGSSGYCVYECTEGDDYYYRIKTNMVINIPIINDLLRLPIFSTTNRMYDFSKLGGE